MNREVIYFYFFLTVVWVFRACLASFVEPWPLQPIPAAAIGQLIASDVQAVLMLIVSVFGVGLYVAMWGDRKIGYFKCRNCNELFTPTFMQYTMGMHIVSTRYLKSPHCKTRT